MSRTAFLTALPKAELHVHLEGSITPEIAMQLARRNGLALPGGDARGLREAYAFRSFRDFLRLYICVSRCLVEVADARDVVVDLARRHARMGVRYAEVTFTPLTHRARGISAEVLWAGLAEGRDEAQRMHGVTYRWVFDVVRSMPQQAEATVDFAIGMDARDLGSVAGVGVGGPEADHYPMEAIGRAFDRARAHGFASLPHAGENAGAASIWTAVRRLGADRIGHGVRALEDPALLQHLRDHGVALEVCPSSNVALGVAPSLLEHPLPALMAHRVPVTLASDDPPMFGTDLIAEYERCIDAFGWDEETVRAVVRAGIEHSFAPPALRDEMLAELSEPSSSPPPSRARA
ncbi:MAG: adenosine deaminase [Nannocystaceae bacterium]|nr:adenosine deaminase [bacterium]